MTPFELVEPETLDDALSSLDSDDPTVRPFAGGTALMLMMKSEAFAPRRLVSLGRVEDARGFRGIDVIDDALVIGAMTPLSTIERSPIVGVHAPVIPRAMKRLANVRVRNVACIGGTLAHGDPHMDLPPILASLGAEVLAVGPTGEHVFAVEDFYRGYYETVLSNDMLIRAVRIPLAAERTAAYLKCTTRSADDWPALGVAVSGSRRSGSLSDVRIVVGAVTDRPTRITEAERELEGRSTDAMRIGDACQAAMAAVDPESDVRGSAAYKRQLVGVYVGRAIRAAFVGDGAAGAMR